MYIDQLSESASFLEDFFHLLRHDLVTIRRQILRTKKPERDSCTIRFQIVSVLYVLFLNKGKERYFFGLLLFIIINNLFICQFREVDSRFRGKKSKAASSLCFETICPHVCSCVRNQRTLQNSLQSQARCMQRGKRQNGLFFY